MQPAEVFDQLVQFALTKGLPATEHFLLWLGLEAVWIAASIAVGVLSLVPIYLCIWSVWIFLKALTRTCNQQHT